MEMQDVVNMVLNAGVSVVVLVYFMYRDFKFMSQLQQTLQTLVDTVDCLKETISNNLVD